MSAKEIIAELPKLTEAELRSVLESALQLAKADKQLHEDPTTYRVVNLSDRNIGEAQAGDLRGRLRAFSEDWERPEDSVYDQDPTR